VTLHQLLVFLTVVETGGFSAAAQRLHITQPAISVQIKALERELGHRLLARSHASNSVELTAAGRMVYRTARRMVRDADKLVAGLERLRIQEETATSVKVISDLLTGTYLLPEVASRYRSHFGLVGTVPSVTLMITTDYNAIAEGVRAGHYDVGIIPARYEAPGTLQEFTFHLGLVAVANAKHREVAECLDWRHPSLVLPPPGSALREMVDRYFTTLGVHPRTVLEATHPEAVKKIVRTSPVLAITHEITVEDDLRNGTLLKLEPPAPLPKQQYQAIRPRGPRNHLAERFCSTLRQSELIADTEGL